MVWSSEIAKQDRLAWAKARMQTTPVTNAKELYEVLRSELASSLVLSPDLPDESVEATLRALWLTAAGTPCSASRSHLFDLPPLTETQVAGLKNLLSSRLAGVPLMQLTGRVMFMGIELLFEPAVFLVRPETEILGNCAVDLLLNRTQDKTDLRMIDVCCGSGNLSCGIAKKVPCVRAISVDILDSCVDLARRNIAHCQLSDRIEVAKGDLFAPCRERGLLGTAHLIVCNPPYIATSRLKADRSYLLEHEPREAFDGGVYGFTMHQRLIKGSRELLKPGGWLTFEFGAGQRKQVQALFDRSGAYDVVDFATDHAGVERVAFARLRPL
jgi:release factor glutamine methyltransferase